MFDMFSFRASAASGGDSDGGGTDSNSNAVMVPRTMATTLPLHQADTEESNNHDDDVSTASPAELRQMVKVLRRDLKESDLKNAREKQELQENYSKELASAREANILNFEKGLIEARQEAEATKKANRFEIEELKKLLKEKEGKLQRAQSELNKEPSTPEAEASKIDELKLAKDRLAIATDEVAQLRSIVFREETVWSEMTKELRETLEEQTITISNLRDKLRTLQERQASPDANGNAVLNSDEQRKLWKTEEPSRSDNVSLNDSGENKPKRAASKPDHPKLSAQKSISKATKKKRSAAEMDTANRSGDATGASSPEDVKMITIRVLPKIPIG